MPPPQGWSNRLPEARPEVGHQAGSKIEGRGQRQLARRLDGLPTVREVVVVRLGGESVRPVAALVGACARLGQLSLLTCVVRWLGWPAVGCHWTASVFDRRRGALERVLLDRIRAEVSLAGAGMPCWWRNHRICSSKRVSGSVQSR
jgi:hypothetical protein